MMQAKLTDAVDLLEGALFESQLSEANLSMDDVRLALALDQLPLESRDLRSRIEWTILELCDEVHKYGGAEFASEALRDQVEWWSARTPTKGSDQRSDGTSWPHAASWMGAYLSSATEEPGARVYADWWGPIWPWYLDRDGLEPGVYRACQEAVEYLQARALRRRYPDKSSFKQHELDAVSLDQTIAEWRELGSEIAMRKREWRQLRQSVAKANKNARQKLGLGSDTGSHCAMELSADIADPFIDQEFARDSSSAEDHLGGPGSSGGDDCTGAQKRPGVDFFGPDFELPRAKKTGMSRATHSRSPAQSMSASRIRVSGSKQYAQPISAIETQGETGKMPKMGWFKITRAKANISPASQTQPSDQIHSGNEPPQGESSSLRNMVDDTAQKIICLQDRLDEEVSQRTELTHRIQEWEDNHQGEATKVIDCMYKVSENIRLLQTSCLTAGDPVNAQLMKRNMKKLTTSIESLERGAEPEPLFTDPSDENTPLGTPDSDLLATMSSSLDPSPLHNDGEDTSPEKTEILQLNRLFQEAYFCLALGRTSRHKAYEALSAGLKRAAVPFSISNPEGTVAWETNRAHLLDILNTMLDVLPLLEQSSSSPAAHLATTWGPFLAPLELAYDEVEEMTPPVVAARLPPALYEPWVASHEPDADVLRIMSELADSKIKGLLVELIVMLM